MHWFRFIALIALSAWCHPPHASSLQAADAQDAASAAESEIKESDPAGYDYDEVLNLLRSQLTDLTDQDWENAASRGLIRELHPKVQLVPEDVSAEGSTPRQTPIEWEVYDDKYGYIHWPSLAATPDHGFLQLVNDFVKTNKLAGLVLDLRFTQGPDYAEATRIADAFFFKEMPLIDWGQGRKLSTAKTNAVDVPVAVLINRQTAEAAEALASVLRKANIALLIGQTTAGQASMYREFQLTTGQKLRVANKPILVGNDDPVPDQGVRPDIQVLVAAAREKLWMQDPYQRLVAAASPGDDPVAAPEEDQDRRHLNEADLVRMLRDGEIPTFSLDTPNAGTPPAPPTIRDPALTRALDFLKGLAVVRRFQSN